MTEIVSEKLKEILSDYIDINVDSITGDMSLEADLGLDSFAVISLMGAIEEAFNIHISDDQLKSFQTFSDLTSFIETTVNS